MARPRNFVEEEVIALAASTFGRLGFNGTTIDDLLTATDLQRGSLYKAFGSKKELFEKVLTAALTDGWPQRQDALDLLIIALKELAANDRAIARLCRNAISTAETDVGQLLGNRLLQNLK